MGVGAYRFCTTFRQRTHGTFPEAPLFPSMCFSALSSDSKHPTVAQSMAELWGKRS